ncbi:MAG TPA: Crp/Fnr family transcriptional regulator [Burkholderiaceae bacterium]|nr:Crp/Fnr family transcriptional regulator [Burkholderiaceae bacterium]
MPAPKAADLAAVPLFASLSQEELQETAQLFTVRSYPKGAIVATEGDHLDLFNIVLLGKVQFFWHDEAGHQVKLGIDGPGGHYADVTLGGEPILMSVIVLEDLRVASIPIAALKALLLRHSQVGFGLLMDVVARLRRLVERTKAFTMEDVYGRVVKLLLATAVKADDKLVTERLTHAEIGKRVGATREMVGRVMRDLVRGGYIEVGRRRVTIARTPPKRW